MRDDETLTEALREEQRHGKRLIW